MDSLINPSSDTADMSLFTGGKEEYVHFFFWQIHNLTHTYTHRSSYQPVVQEERRHEAQLHVKD
jgi:hypothetical protein